MYFAHISHPNQFIQLPKKWVDVDGVLTVAGRTINIPKSWKDSPSGLAKLRQLGLYPARRETLPEGSAGYSDAVVIGDEIVKQAVQPTLLQWKRSMKQKAREYHDRLTDSVLEDPRSVMAKQVRLLLLMYKMVDGQTLSPAEIQLRNQILVSFNQLRNYYKSLLTILEEIDALDSIDTTYDVEDPAKWPQ